MGEEETLAARPRTKQDVTRSGYQRQDVSLEDLQLWDRTGQRSAAIVSMDSNDDEGSAKGGIVKKTEITVHESY